MAVRPPDSSLPPVVLITRLARRYGVSVPLALAISSCEDGNHDPLRKNYLWPESTAGGMYMFVDGTWLSVRRHMGLPTDIALKWNMVENVRTAMWALGHGQVSHWNASRSCWQPKLP